ncbi:MAG: reverse transcriptase domain-containing protein [bacterium]
MPFGLRNAAQTFQRFMDRILKHLPVVFCYLDDIIIASHNSF